MKPNPRDKLHNYGIHTEESELRTHVCPVAKRIYIFPTASGLAALPKGIGKYGYQQGVQEATAFGYCVKPFDIAKCVSMQIKDTVWDFYKFNENDDTTTKGKKAVNLIKAMIVQGLFPLPAVFNATDKLPKYMEIKGQDILVRTSEKIIKIQVKCDFKGGEEDIGGSGFLYLQTKEINPHKKH